MGTLQARLISASSAHFAAWLNDSLGRGLPTSSLEVNVSLLAKPRFTDDVGGGLFGLDRLAGFLAPAAG